MRSALRQTPVYPALRWIRGQIRLYRMPKMQRMNRIYDLRTIDLIRRTPGNHVDVGASAGSILTHMVEAHPDGKHIAFEAIPESAVRLQQKFPNVDVHAVALSDAPGDTTFNVASNSGYSGMRRIDYPEGTTTRQITVPMETMDRLVHRPVHFVKIDVEGAELQVLRGARRILSEHRPMIVFEHGLAARHYGTTPQQVHDLLSELGYGLFLLGSKHPLSRDRFAAEASRHWYFVARPQ